MRGTVVPRRIATATLALGLALTALLALAPPCLACSCVPSTPEEGFRRADAAFVGTVVRDVMAETGTTQTFEVDQVFKGELPATVDVWAQIGTRVVNSCAILYPSGDRVAVLLFEDEGGRWQAQACTQVSEAELRKVGGAPTEPLDVASPSDGPSVTATGLGEDGDGGGLPSWAVVGLGALVAVVAVGAQLAWAGRRGRREAQRSGFDPVDDPQEVQP